MSPDFNPRSPYGERRPNHPPPCAAQRFQSTLPLRGATSYGRSRKMTDKISIHAPLTGSDHNLSPFLFPGGISIHAPLTGSDVIEKQNLAHQIAISIHAPLTGSDYSFKLERTHVPLFQSTLPLRGATGINALSADQQRLFQSTLPLRGATMFSFRIGVASIFQSTLPLRGATFLHRRTNHAV